MKGLILGSLAIALFAGVIYGHHSMAGFDRAKEVTVEGTVKEFRWANPHAWMEIEVPKAKGGVDVWNFEMTSPAILVRAGWKSSTVKFGDKVKVTGRPLKTGDPGALFVSVTLQSGQVLTERAAPQAPAAQSPAPARP